MTTTPLLINADSSLATLPELQSEFNLVNYFTYSQSVWGNMALKYAETPDDYKLVQTKNRSFLSHFPADKSLNLHFPVESLFLDYDEVTDQELTFQACRQAVDQKSVLQLESTANAVLVRVPGVTVMAKPADCIIALLINPRFEGFYLMHLGFPQLMQGFHLKAIQYLQASVPSLQLPQSTVYFFPHIAGINYRKKVSTLEDIKRKLPQRYHPNVVLLDSDSYAIDFPSIITQEWQSRFGLTDIRVTDCNTYQEAQQGKLFSNQLNVEQPEQNPAGRFAIGVCRQSA